MAEEEEPKAVVWKHIGLHGNAVGTFSCEPKHITWRSAVSSRDDSVGGTAKTIPAASLKGALWSVFGRSGHLRVQTKPKPDGTLYHKDLKHELRFDGFPTKDFDTLKSTLKEMYDLEIQKHGMSSAGTQYGLTKIQGKNIVFRHCILEDADEEGEEFEPREGDEMMSLDLTEVSQCVLPGNNRNEIELQFPESDTVEAGTDQLVAVRFYIPPDPDIDPNDKSIPYPAELLQQRIMQTASIRKTTGDILVEFEQSKGTFLTPRGRYAIELYDWFLRLRGQKYDYKIKYDDINRLFLLPKPDEVHMAFVIALDKPIRQGQQRYQYLVLQATKDPDEITVNMDEETLQKEYGGELQPVMRGSLSNLVAKTFKVIAKKKVFIPGKFANANQQACVKCALRANDGLLYPLEKQFVFIHKPPILIRFNEVESVEFQRYAGGQGSTRNFDLCVNLKASAMPAASGVKEYTFMGIDRSDYAGLYSFLSGKKIKIKNLEGVGSVVEAPRQAPVYNEDEIYGGPDPDGDEESEDDDYDEKAAEADEAKAKEELDSDESDIDDEDLGSEIDDELDSDLEEARNGGKKKSPKKKSSKSSSKGASDDEGASPPPKKKAKKAVSKKSSKDPNAPKKAMSAYLLFSSHIRPEVKKENPDAPFAEIAKIIGAKYKKLSPEERAKWDKKAGVEKQRYKDEMADYSAPEEDSDDDDKKKKPAKKKKDPNAPKKPTTSFMQFNNANRARIKKENPDATFSEMAKLVSVAWKAIEPDEKKKYEDLAATDKQRYLEAMKTYVPPKDTGNDEKGGKGGKSKKDPNAPKRPMTAFMLYSNANRAKVKSENPGISFGELGKKMGELFKALSAEERAKYDELNAKDKERYKKQTEEYQAKAAKEKEEDSDSDDSDSDSDDSDSDSDSD